MGNMVELSRTRTNSGDFKGMRTVQVVSDGNKYIQVTGGHCGKYRKDVAEMFGLDGCCIAYHPCQDYSDGKYDTLLFPEQWMADLYIYRQEKVKEAQRILNKVGLNGLSETALREICKCGITEDLD